MLMLFYAHSNEALLLITINSFGCSIEVPYLIISYIFSTSIARVIFMCTQQFYKVWTNMQNDMSVSRCVGNLACGFRHGICQSCLEQNGVLVSQFVGVLDTFHR